MRYIPFIVVFLFLLGCAGERPVFSEHASEAAMESAVQYSVWIVDENGGTAISTCALPQERNMEQSLADRFVQDNSGILADETSLEVSLDGAQALVNLCSLPVLESAVMEEALLDALTGTMTQLPGVESVRFTFDGETLAELPNGTRCFGEFGVD